MKASSGTTKEQKREHFSLKSLFPSPSCFINKESDFNRTELLSVKCDRWCPALLTLIEVRRTATLSTNCGNVQLI